MLQKIHSIIVLLLLFSTHGVKAQEQARYQITYDCETQKVTGVTTTFRWTLDIGDTTTVFYNANSRAFNREMAKLNTSGDATALLNQIPEIAQKYNPHDDLQIAIGVPEKGKYTCYDKLVTSGLKYEEKLPTIEWQLTDSIKTICEYECKQAWCSIYGRTWTVWYSPELPLNYGPYVLCGLPGLILAAQDADGLFCFNAVGIENAPKDARVTIFEENNHQKCSRKRFLEIRAESEGLSRNQLIDRITYQSSNNSKVIVYSMSGTGDNYKKSGVPKCNHLDKE